METIADNTQKGCMLASLCLISLVACIYFFYTSYMFCGFNPKDNPTVEGMIIKSSIEKSNIERRGYSIDVTYEYHVEGQRYLSNRICCDTSANDFSKDIIAKYPVGSKVKVYYRDKKPNLSVIEPRLGRNGAVFVFAFGFLFLGILFLIIFQTRSNSIK